MNRQTETKNISVGNLLAEVNSGVDARGDVVVEIFLSHQEATNRIAISGYDLFDLFSISVNLGQAVLDFLAENELDRQVPDYFNILSLQMERLLELRDPRVRVGDARYVQTDKPNK